MARTSVPAARTFNQDVLGLDLRVLDEDIEVAVLVEDASIKQLVFLCMFVARLVGFDDLHARVLGVRVLVEVLHVRVGRRTIEIEVVLLDIFAVIALAVTQPE